MKFFPIHQLDGGDDLQRFVRINIDAVAEVESYSGEGCSVTMISGNRFPLTDPEYAHLCRVLNIPLEPSHSNVAHLPAT